MRQILLQPLNIFLRHKKHNASQIQFVNTRPYREHYFQNYDNN